MVGDNPEHDASDFQQAPQEVAGWENPMDVPDPFGAASPRDPQVPVKSVADDETAMRSLMRRWQVELAPALAKVLADISVEALPRREHLSTVDTASQVDVGTVQELLLSNEAFEESYRSISLLLEEKLHGTNELELLISQANESLSRDPRLEKAIDGLFDYMCMQNARNLSNRTYRVGLVITLLLGGWLPSISDQEAKVDDVTIPMAFVANELLKNLEKNDKSIGKSKPNDQSRGRAAHTRDQCRRRKGRK